MTGPVVLSAGFPDEEHDRGEWLELEIEEAILSLCRAVLARGGELVVPADPVVAPLVAAIGGEYAQPVEAEALGARDRPLVHVLFTDGRDGTLSEQLDPLPHVRTVAFDDDASAAMAFGDEPKAGRRHRLTPRALSDLAPLGAVVLGGAPESGDDFDAMRAVGIAPVVIGSTLAGALLERPELHGYDLVAGLLAEYRGDDREEDLPIVPYPFVMQVIVDGWAGDDDWRHRGTPRERLS